MFTENGDARGTVLEETAVTTTNPQKSAKKRRLSIVGLVEALATPHAIDRYLELVNPMVTVRDLRAEITGVRRQTADTVTLTLRPTWQWEGFKAGQFVQVGVVINGVRHTRCYSPANSQHGDKRTIELTVKAHPEGLVSQHLRNNARVGEVIDLSQSGGQFHLPDVRPDNVLLVSGGSGITPVLSMLRTLVDEGYRGRVTFLHYAYTEKDVTYLHELRSIAAAHDNIDLVLAYTDENAGGDLQGFFGIEHLKAAAPWYEEAETFLCGPPGLMKSVQALFGELGLSERLHTEEFQPAPLAIDDDETPSGTLTFSDSNAAKENSGASLLEEAESAGLSPEFGCRMGICFTCTAVKTSGCTKSLLTGELNDNPDEPIQLCVSKAVGDVTIRI
jgi:ferredoxin-NADP reductase